MSIELFHQACRFSPFWMAVDGLCILHFFVSWARTVRSTGWKIDFWYFTLALSFLIPVLAMYPFHGSIYNTIACGKSFAVFESLIDWAFAITLLGYASVWIGRWLYDVFRWESPFYFAVVLLRPLQHIVEKNIKSRRTVLFASLITVSVGVLILMIQISEGYFFNPRAFFLKNDLLRPIFNLGISLMPSVIVFLSLRWIQFQERLSKFLMILFFLFTLCFGLRALTIGSLITVCLYQILAKEGKIKFSKLFLGSLALCLLAVYMDSLRSGLFDFRASLAKFIVTLLYGNNLSDTRDFAWILAYWDGEYVFGKTYLAGLLSFFPRFISPFRQEWAVSLYTNSLVNFDSSVHAGLRPGLFGEAFLNFSYPGVVFLGLCAGYLLRHADLKLKQAVAHRDIILGYSHTLVYAFVSSFFITSGLWSFYTFILLNLILYALGKIRIKRDLLQGS